MTENGFKAVFAGDVSVGKTAIFIALTKHELGANPPHTVGGAFSPINATDSDSSPVIIRLWDTAGQEKYRTIVPLYFKGADVIVLVYDITRKDSFDKIEYWMNFARAHAPEDCAFVIVGNKSDLVDEREVSMQTGCALQESLKAVGLFETSAFTGVGIEELTTAIADATVKVRRTSDDTQRLVRQTIENPGLEPSQSDCC
jgi:small GTP-binding protein